MHNDPNRNISPNQQQDKQNTSLDIKDYFQRLVNSSHNRIDKKINEEISDGVLPIPAESQNIEAFLIQEKITAQQRKAKQLKLKREKINVTLQYLDMQIRGSSEHELNLGNVQGSILSKQQHSQVMKKLQKRRLEASQRRIKLQNSLQRQRAEIEQKQKQMHDQAMQNIKQSRRQKLQEKSQKLKEQQQKRSGEKQSQENLLKIIKKRKFLYQEMEERFQSQHTLPKLEEKKKKLKQIKQIKAFSIEEINNHQEQYLQKKEQRASNKSKIDNENSWVYNPPKKSEKLAKLVENEQIQMRNQLLQKKKIIEENIAKQEMFVEYLRQKFPPKANEKKKQQLINRINNLHVRKRQSLNNKEIGNSYFQEIKKKKSLIIRSKDNAHTNKSLMFPKKYDVKTEENQDQSNHRSYTNYLKKPLNRNYTELRRKKIQKLLNSDGSSQEKIHLLNLECKRLNQKAKRKEELLRVFKSEQIQQETIDLLLNSIKTKLSIAKIYNQII